MEFVSVIQASLIYREDVQDQHQIILSLSTIAHHLAMLQPTSTLNNSDACLALVAASAVHPAIPVPVASLASI